MSNLDQELIDSPEYCVPEGVPGTLRLLGVVLAIVFSGEYLVMLQLGMWYGQELDHATAVIDSCLLSLLLSVPMWLLFRRHFSAHVTVLNLELKRRRHAEQVLQAAKEEAADNGRMLQLVLDTIPVRVFWKGRNSRYLGCNRLFAEDAGRSHTQEIIGEDDYALGWSEQADLYRADDQAVMAQGIAKLNYEEPQTTPDGKRIWLRTSKIPLTRTGGEVVGVLGTYENVTERKELELELQQAHDELESRVSQRTEQLEEVNQLLTHRAAQLQETNQELALKLAVIQASPDMIVFTDRNGVIQDVNPAVVATTGYEAAELVDRNISLFNSGTHEEEFFQELWHAVLAGESWRGEIVNSYKDGSLHTEEMSITPHRGQDGEIESFVAIKRDVTERRVIESRLRQAEKLESLGRLAAGVAHEINTPIQYISDNIMFVKKGVSGMSELLGQYQSCLQAAPSAGDEPEGLRRLEELKDQVESAYPMSEMPLALSQTQEGLAQIARIVKSLYQFAHPDSEEKAPIDLNAVVQSAVDLSRNEWKYVAEMELQLDRDLPLIPGHFGQIVQVVVNLIINARDAIQDTGGDAITISTGRTVEGCQISVADNGAGVSPELQGKIFEPFFTTKEVGRGTGQGLSLAHNSIVVSHSGTIAVDSAADGGAIFTITLPSCA